MKARRQVWFASPMVRGGLGTDRESNWAVRATATVAQFTSAGVEGGDTLLVFTLLATGEWCPVHREYPPGLNTIYDEQPSVRVRIAIGYALWPQQDLVAEARNDNSITVRALANLTALVLRGGGTPALLTTGRRGRGPGTLMVAMCRCGYHRIREYCDATGGLGSGARSDVASGCGRHGGVGWAAHAIRRHAHCGRRRHGDRWRLDDPPSGIDVMRPTVAIVGVTIDRAIIWTDPQSDRTLAPNETIFVSAGANAPFTDVVPPAAGTDFTVDVGSITAASIAPLRTPISVTILLTAGASGATISGLQLRGSPLTREVVSKPSPPRNAASVAKWGSRQPRLERIGHILILRTRRPSPTRS